MSRAACNRALSASAAIALLILLNWYVFVQPPAQILLAVPEFVGKWLLLWVAVALVVGVGLEAATELRRWTRRARTPAESPAQVAAAQESAEHTRQASR